MNEMQRFTYTNRDGQEVLVVQDYNGEKVRYLVVNGFAYEVTPNGSYALVGAGETAETGATPVQHIVTEVKGEHMEGGEWQNERVTTNSIVMRFWTGKSTESPIGEWRPVGFQVFPQVTEEPVVEPVVEPVKSISEQVEDLVRQVAMLTEVRDSYKVARDYAVEAVQEYERDVERMNQILNESADDANLCSRYEDALDEVNRRCKRITLTGRERTFTATVNVTLSFDATRGSEQDQAEELMQTIFGESSTSFSWDVRRVEED